VGLDYWILPRRTSRLRSSLSDHFGCLPARTLSAQLPDGVDQARGIQGCRASGAPAREHGLAPPGRPGPLRAGRPTVAGDTVAIGFRRRWAEAFAVTPATVLWPPSSRSGHRRPGRRRSCPLPGQVASEARHYCGAGSGQPLSVRRPGMPKARSGARDQARRQQESRSVSTSLTGPGSQVSRCAVPDAYTFADDAHGLSRLRLRRPRPWWSRPVHIDVCSMFARTPRYARHYSVSAARRGCGQSDRMAAPGTC
jgi:hypothetical protein